MSRQGAIGNVRTLRPVCAAQAQRGSFRLGLLLACLILPGCERAMHDMYEQPKYLPGAPSPLFADGSSRSPPPVGSIPAHTDNEQSPPVSEGLLERGRGRYNIYCAPCHGESGYGDGMVVQRGFPSPPSYHSDALRNAPDRQFYDVITNGYGVMYPYADRLTPADRWAVIAYIRALQLSQDAPRGRLDESDLQRLERR